MTILVNSGCYNKNTIVWVTYTTNMYFSQFQRLEVQDLGASRCGEALSLLAWLTSSLDPHMLSLE